MDTQLSALQASVEDKNTLLTRLRSELAVGERNLGLKTAGLIAAEALVSTRERETEAMRRELTTQTESLFQAMQKAKELEGKVESLETGLAERLSQEEVKKSEMEFRESNIIKKYEDIITEMKLNTEDRLETIKRENFKKSSLARTLLTEREEENDFLRTKNEELVNEIQSGAPSDRRFFELAEIQAKREAVHGQHG
jgi:chromosome segregation ATPase